MRIIASMLLLLGFCYAQQYDTKVILKDFQNQNQAKYTVDTLPTWQKEEVTSKYLDLADVSSHNVVCKDQTLQDPNQYRCPKGKGDYTTSLYSVNLATTSMQCLLAKKGVLEKPLAIFNWNLNDFPRYDLSSAGKEFNPDVGKDELENEIFRKITGNSSTGGTCSNLFVENRKDAIKANTTAIEKSKAQFAGLNEAKVKYSKKSEQNGENIGIPHLLTSVILGDNNVIDIQSTLNHNELILRQGFKPKGANYLRAKTVVTQKASDTTILDAYNLGADAAGGYLNWGLNLTKTIYSNATMGTRYFEDYNVKVQKLENISSNQDIVSNLINYRLIAMLEFFPKWSKLNQDLYMMLASIIGLVMIIMYGASRAAQHADEEKNQRNSSAIIWFGVLFASAITFLPTTEPENVTVDGENYRVTNNNFQKIETMGYYTAIDFANGIAKAVIDSEISSIIKRVGGVQTDNLISTFAQNELFYKEIIINQIWLQQCGASYNIDFIKKYNSTQNYYFPPSEQWIYANYANFGRTPNYYTPATKGGALKADNMGLYPALSLSFCNKVEKRHEYLYARYNSNKDLISKAAAGVDSAKLQMIENLIRSQYGMYQEWGFFSILSTPLITFKAQQMGRLFNDDQKDNASNLLDQERNSIAKKVAYYSPLMLIPGVSNLYNLIKDNSGTILGALSSGAGSFIPGAGTAVGGVVGTTLGFVASSAVGFAGTIYIVEEILKLVPIISIVMFGLLILIKIIIKILAYHLIAPFVIVVSFSKQNTQILTNFFSRVISIMLEIPIFVLSVWAAMSAHDLLISIGTPLSSTLMKIMGEITTDQSGGDFMLLSHGLDFIAQGFIMVLLHLFSFVIVYKILSTFHTQIFEAVEVKSATAFDDVVEKMTNSAQSWGHRI